MSDPVLEADGVSVMRGAERVLTDVSFQVQAGEVFALLGGNGAGKSTTLLTFLGFLTPVSGQARVMGTPVAQDIAGVRGRSAYLPEAAALYPHLSARENLSYFLALAGLTRSAQDMEAALDRVSLQAKARDQRMETYSKGMRQKTAIALALLRHVPILFLDEPTSGLDPLAIDEFNGLIRDLAAEGTTVLMVTHDVYGACQVADRIGLLKDGGLVGLFEARNAKAGSESRIDTEAVHRAFAARSAS